MMKISQKTLVFVLSLILVFSACDGFSQKSQEIPEDPELSVSMDSISVIVLDVLLRNSVQTHYLMSYPEPGHVFFEVVLTIQGLEDPPSAVLNWGANNLSLNCDGKDAKLAFPRRVIADEKVEYIVGEVVNFLHEENPEELLATFQQMEARQQVGDLQNLLYYLSRKYLKTPNGHPNYQRRLKHEISLGIHNTRRPLNLDVGVTPQNDSV